MSEIISSLPNRKMTREEVMSLTDQIDGVDWCASPNMEGDIIVFIMVFNDVVYSLGFLEDSEEWEVITRIERSTEETGKIQQLNNDIREWGKKRYDDENIVPVFPDVSDSELGMD